MTELTTLSCVACSGDEPVASPKEIETLRLQVPEWVILNSDGVGKLERVFDFNDFKAYSKWVPIGEAITIPSMVESSKIS